MQETMLTIRCTKKLLERLKLPTTSPEVPPASTTALGDWYATYIPCRPKHLILAVSERCRIAVLLPAAPLQTLAPRFLEAARRRLEALRISPETVEQEVAAMQPVVFAPNGPTRSRSVLATVTQFIEVLEYRQERGETPEELALYLGGFGVGASEYFRPDGAARELLDPQIVAEEERFALQLRVTVQDSEPPIWRQLLVPAGLTLHQFHNVLQGAFGWKRSHLHRFFVGESSYAPRYLFDEDFEVDPTKSDRTISLLQALPNEGSRLLYVYDMGDNWRHEVVLEKRVEPSVSGPRCRCFAGERSGPPEDSGGIYSYNELVAALSGEPSELDPEELADWLEWAGPGFDPARFDVEKCFLYAH